MLISDSRFRVEVDYDATSPNPQQAIWRGQHTCVSEHFAFDEQTPTPQRCGEVIIKHQLAGDRGHFSVLRKAFISFCCAGFPHSMVAQITRHQDSGFLVQSNRYTGKRFIWVAEGKLEVEDVFYFRPVGNYRDRAGNSYYFSEENRQAKINRCLELCKEYALEISSHCPYEMSRENMPYNFRQNFDISGDLQSVWHWMDQRSKADSELEIQTFSHMIMDKLHNWCPELASWYRSNRYGKAKLAP